MNKSKKTPKSTPHLRIFAVFAALAVLVFAASRLPYIEKKFIYPEKHSILVEKYAALNGLDKYYIYAVIKTESGFNPSAVSEAGAVGLMQIMEDSFNWIKDKMGDECADEEYEDLYDPETNIKYGTYLLKLLYEEYGALETSCAAYHTGRGNVNKWLSDKNYSADGVTLSDMPSAVTKHYVYKVMTAYEGYTNLYCGNG